MPSRGTATLVRHNLLPVLVALVAVALVWEGVLAQPLDTTGAFSVQLLDECTNLSLSLPANFNCTAWLGAGNALAARTTVVLNATQNGTAPNTPAALREFRNCWGCIPPLPGNTVCPVNMSAACVDAVQYARAIQVQTWYMQDSSTYAGYFRLAQRFGLACRGPLLIPTAPCTAYVPLAELAGFNKTVCCAEIQQAKVMTDYTISNTTFIGVDGPYNASLLPVDASQLQLA